MKTIYLKKVYYQNATPAQVAAYKRAADTPNGWVITTQAEYVQFQKDPYQGAFYSRILGADTPSKQLEILGEVGFGAPKYLKGTQEATLKFKSTGVDFDGNKIKGDVTLTIFDDDGNIVSSSKQSYTDDEELNYDVNLEQGQYFTVTNSNEKSTGSEYGVYSKGKKGENRQDNMNAYGNEMPTDTDKKAVSKVVGKRKTKKR